MKFNGNKRPFWKKKRWDVFVSFLVFVLFMYQYMELRWSARTFKNHLHDAPFGYGLTSKCLDVIHPTGRKICCTEIGSDSLPLVVFLHGSPASSSIYKRFLKDSTLLQHAKLLVIDRPGYGYSDFGNLEPDIQKQAALIATLLQEKQKKHKRIILLGASYGGTVAARISMDYPTLIDGLILQSASLKAGAETIYSISYPTSHWTLAWLMPYTIQMANVEKFSHKTELEKMIPYWSKIKATCTILHGAKDKLIWPENAFYAKEKLHMAASLDFTIIKENGHDLIWTQYNLIVSKVINTIHRTENFLQKSY